MRQARKVCKQLNGVVAMQNTVRLYCQQTKPSDWLPTFLLPDPLWSDGAYLPAGRPRHKVPYRQWRRPAGES